MGSARRIGKNYWSAFRRLLDMATGQTTDRAKRYFSEIDTLEAEAPPVQTGYLRARDLSPLGAAEGTGRPRLIRNLSKSLTPMPSCRAIGSGPLDCLRNR